MKRILFFLLIAACSAFGQNHLKNVRNKTAGQLANSPNGTRMDSTFFINRIGVWTRDLGAAIEERGLTPYDFSTLAVAKDTAVARKRPLIVPWNYTASALTFRDADSALVMYVYGTVNITASDTIPAGAQIIALRSGRFAVSSGVTLTINGNFSAPRRRKFTTTGSVAFGAGAVEAIYPEWFGASNDSTLTISDSGPAFKKAFDAAAHGSVVSLANEARTLNAPKGYVITTTVRFPSDRQITLQGNGAVIYSSGTDTLFLIQNGSQTTVPSYAISPTRDQPRHNIENIRFKRITGSTGLGVPIALVNSTGNTMRGLDVYDYNNGIVFSNISDGWCEFNLLADSRFSSCDTVILFKVTQAGNNSFASNKLERVTMTAFTTADVIIQNTSQAVGLYTSANSNIYRNSWDNVIIFPTDSTTCFNINGQAENVTGNAHIEVIGSSNLVRSRAFHFGTDSENLMFNVHLDVTGRRYIDDFFFNQSSSSFGPLGLKTIVQDQSSNASHGISMLVDSSKFSDLFSIMRQERLGNFTVTPGDTAHWLFANMHSGERGRLTIRGWRNKPIVMRSMNDGNYDDGNGLLPVRLLDIGSKRSVNDSTVIDVRNATFLLIGNNVAALDTFKAMKGGIAGQVVMTSFSSDSTYLANLSGGTGTGRLFLNSNASTHIPSGTKITWFCDTEAAGPSGGTTFWREMSNMWPIKTATWNPANLTAGSTDSTTFTYVGAAQGDPVVVGHTSINSTMAFFSLRGFVIQKNTIRILLTNNSAGAIDVASGTLKVKIIK